MELSANQIKTLKQLLIEHTTDGYTDHTHLSANPRELAHLLECGFITKLHMFSSYRITSTGRGELARLFNPRPDPAETLRAEIAALERQLADKRAALGAVESGENSVM